eukprot:TRINITY_DN1499_c0_g2_i3.p1 TRINITY_DN1499_c0_g2~~TRINITY_DN1499_c0_g2_i3.p1  ORF type:complete len:124 (+),score=28.92 TRINITY_DN1499_c0_g2_i3:55-372(+)
MFSAVARSLRQPSTFSQFRRMFSEGADAARRPGVVKWFNDTRGFGFITPTEGDEPDIFVHFTAINEEGFRTLREGELVEYEIAQGRKGQHAANVTKAQSGETYED